MNTQVSSAKTLVLYVITKGNWGGAQRYVYDLATSLPKDQFEVHVAFGQKGRLAEKLHDADITTHEIISLQRDVSLAADVRCFFELRKLFKAVQPDIVHLNSSKAGGIGALAARTAGVKKIVFTAHGWPFLEDRNLVARACMWLFSWVTALLSHRTITISNYDLSIARRMPFVSRRMLRIYNGIGTISFGTGERIRSAFPPGVSIVGTIGELNKNKNQAALIEEARNKPAMHVAIVGEGELRPTLEDAIRTHGLESRVKLFGFIPVEEVLKGIDVFALPSKKEGLPYVLLEARAAGVPIEANRVGGVGEILDDTDQKEFTLERMVTRTIACYRN